MRLSGAFPAKLNQSYFGWQLPFNSSLPQWLCISLFKLEANFLVGQNWLQLFGVFAGCSF
jgi:hypothetical protein